MISGLNPQLRSAMRIPYALRHIPESRFARLLPLPDAPARGDVALAQVESIGKNTRLELANGRPASLHHGDLIAVVFGNRYATAQFEGYVGRDGANCDILSMGGMCGLVKSKHANVSEPSTLRLLGAIGDPAGRPLRMAEYGLAPAPAAPPPRLVVVCGTSMDAGKTHTAMSLIVGLRRRGHRVAGIKLTGTAAGRDKWTMLDAGASPAFDFTDGGYPSTYLCSLDELLSLHELLVSHAAAAGADWAVIEIADGVLQAETSALLQSPAFTASISAWVFATSDPLAAAGGVAVLRRWRIEPAAVSGLISMSPLAMREAAAATGIECLTAAQLQSGDLADRLAPQTGDASVCVCNGSLRAVPAT